MQGPRQSPYNLYSGVLRAFALSVYFKRRPAIYEHGQQLRDHVNIEDAVRANLLVMEDPKADYQVYNVGGAFGYEVSPRITGSSSI